MRIERTEPLDFYQLVKKLYDEGASAIHGEVFADWECYPHRTIAVFVVRPLINPLQVIEWSATWINALIEEGYLPEPDPQAVQEQLRPNSPIQ